MFSLDMLDVFVPEIPESGQNRIGGRLPQAAEGCGLDVHGQLLQFVQILHLAFATANPIQDVEHVACAHTAGRALPARLILRKLQEVPGDIDHAGALVHDDETTRSHDGSGFLHRVVVDWKVEILHGQATTGGATELGRLERAVVRYPAPDVVDHLPQGGPHGDFHQARVVHAPGQGEDLGSRATLGAEPPIPILSVENDGRNVGKGLHIVDAGRLALVTPFHREGRPGRGHAAVAFKGSDEGGFLAADKGPRAHTQLDVEVEAAPQDVLAQEAPFSGLI